jgi:DNA-directed RNA polymerase sigma subunit (sigma70/sigma32)
MATFESIMFLKTVARRLTVELDREPTIEELASDSKVQQKRLKAAAVKALLELSYQLPSLDDLLDEETNSIFRPAAHYNYTEDAALRNVEKERLTALLDRTVDSRTRQMLELRFGLVDGVQRSMLEIRGIMGISDSIISKRIRSALMTLKQDPLFREAYEGYFSL